MTTKLVDVIAGGDRLGECPIWSVVDQRLWWTDILGCRLRSWDYASGLVTDWPTQERLCAFALTDQAPDLVLAAFETGLAWLSIRGQDRAPDWIDRPEVGAGRRFNDGRTDRQGRFWVGSMIERLDLAAPASATLWRYDELAGLSPQIGGVTISNGLATSADGRTLYFADSPRQTISAYDLDPNTGELSGERLFAKVERGLPDGAVVDAQDRLWSARWGGGEVVCHAPDGRVVEVVKTPTSNPTCVAFGGPDLSLMFVTSASDGLTAEDRAAQPLAGAVFVYASDTAGIAEVPVRSPR